MKPPIDAIRSTAQSTIRVNGVDLVADLSGALWWPGRRTLVVADLHLEKGSGFAARGALLPPYDTAATLGRLEAVVGRLRPDRVICLGDSFHDDGARARLPPSQAARISALTAAHDWLWIAGNHDPEPPDDWGGAVRPDLVDGALVFRHHAEPGAAGEVSGHYHPRASIATRARRVRGRCFVGDGRRLILPAFGAYTGGLDVLDPAIAGLFAGGFRVHLLGRDAIYAFPKAALAA